MTEDEVLAEFRASHALLEGHFLLSSGRHSAFYLQCARVLMNPERASRRWPSRRASRATFARKSTRWYHLPWVA